MKDGKKKSFGGIGAIAFFVLIAVIMQSAVLVYDYVIKRTDDKLVIALIILAVIILFSSICTLIDFFRRRFTVDKPLKKILSATEQIAKGDFNVKLSIEHEYGKYNAYDLIADNVNKMAAELKTNEILKTDFISNVSHEMKTPLSVIRNYACLLQGNLEESDRINYAKTLISATDKLSCLVSNVLKLNKLENQEIKGQYERFSLTESLSQSILEFEPLLESKNIELVCDLEDVDIYSAKSLLEIVWSNLLSNAIKFTSNGGKIEVYLTRNDSSVIVAVKDNGCGISKEIGKKIFEKFYQGDTSRSKEGNGLGLALVKKVIDILGGEISVESEINKGSVFTITLTDNKYE